MTTPTPEQAHKEATEGKMAILSIHHLVGIIGSLVRGESLDPEICETVEDVVREYECKDFGEAEVLALYKFGWGKDTAADGADKSAAFVPEQDGMPDTIDYLDSKGLLTKAQENDTFELTRWCGKPIEEMSRDELIAALNRTAKDMRKIVTGEK